MPSAVTSVPPRLCSSPHFSMYFAVTCVSWLVSGLARHCDNIYGAGYITEESFV